MNPEELRQLIDGLRTDLGLIQSSTARVMREIDRAANEITPEDPEE